MGAGVAVVVVFAFGGAMSEGVIKKTAVLLQGFDVERVVHRHAMTLAGEQPDGFHGLQMFCACRLGKPEARESLDEGFIN